MEYCITMLGTRKPVIFTLKEKLSYKLWRKTGYDLDDIPYIIGFGTPVILLCAIWSSYYV